MSVQLSCYLYRGSTEHRKSCTTRSRAILASSYLRAASKLILDVTALRPFRRAKDYSPDHLPDIHGMRPHRWGETHQPDTYPLTWNLSQKGSLVIRWKVALERKCVVIYGYHRMSWKWNRIFLNTLLFFYLPYNRFFKYFVCFLLFERIIFRFTRNTIIRLSRNLLKFCINRYR